MKRLVCFVVFAWFGVACAAQAAPAEQRETPQPVLQAPAQRIITLAPHLAELVFAAGAGDKLVGVSTYSDFPSEAARLPVVANDGKVNVEEVLRLKPDLVLAWQGGNRTADIERLKDFGVRVIVTQAEQIEDVSQLLRAIGALAGTQNIAQARALQFEQQIAALRERYAQRRPVRSFIEIWHAPLMTVNGAHYISSIVALCGGVNVFANTATLTPTISREQLYATDIQAVLSLAFKAPQQAHATWASADTLPAVRAGHVYALDPDLLSRMSPRLAQGAAQVCAALDQVRSSTAPAQPR